MRYALPRHAAPRRCGHDVWGTAASYQGIMRWCAVALGRRCARSRAARVVCGLAGCGSQSRHTTRWPRTELSGNATSATLTTFCALEQRLSQHPPLPPPDTQTGVWAHNANNSNSQSYLAGTASARRLYRMRAAAHVLRASRIIPSVGKAAFPRAVLHSRLLVRCGVATPSTPFLVRSFSITPRTMAGSDFTLGDYPVSLVRGTMGFRRRQNWREWSPAGPPSSG